jgi:hypothetical protein
MDCPSPSDFVSPHPVVVSTDNSSSSHSPPISDNPNFSDSASPYLVPRKSTRVRRPTDYLQQYHCQLAFTSPGFVSKVSSSSNSGISFPLSSFVSHSNLSSSFKHFCLSISSDVEPQYYHQAVKHDHWRNVMATEIAALEENHTWIVTDLPPGKHLIGCKWVYKIKYKVDGSIERYKARLVAKRYTQSEGLNYHETFSQLLK